MAGELCSVVAKGGGVELRSPAFLFRLDTRSGLRAVSWVNRLTGQTVCLGAGAELECGIDAAERRIGITGWRTATSPCRRAAPPDTDGGYREGYQQPWFDDSKWPGALSPAIGFGMSYEQEFLWARTHVFLPEHCAQQPLRLILGGLGLFDFRYMRVFLNGHAIGTRRVQDRWHEPGDFNLSSAAAAHAHARFGQDNVIALQLAEPMLRTARLDELDPRRARKLGHAYSWPAQFEQYLVAGEPMRAAAWRVDGCTTQREGPVGEVVVKLTDDACHLKAEVTYRWKADEPTLHRFTTITNAFGRAVRVMDVGLGRYRTGCPVSQGEQGFPVYVDDAFFVSLAHPSGWAMGQRGEIGLRQYPGQKLASGATFSAMEVVLGVAPKGDARPAFLAHVRRRMRRVVRGHDRAYAIYEPYGSWPQGEGVFLGEAESDKILLGCLHKVARGQRECGCHFDCCSIDFWVDRAGDLQRTDPKGFPQGFANVRRALKGLGTHPGLWIDANAGWTIGKNPVVSGCYTHDPAYGPGSAFCRATDPIRGMYTSAFRHHLRENGVRLLKFDGLQAICYRPQHDHLPGLYSTEAIQTSVVDFLRALDAECRDVFLMLYWGHRSPWWLLHADTLFESGLCIEAASPAAMPSLYARDGVTQVLDQSQWWAEDVPPLGKDSLGVWLSDWPWNSMIGKERWQEGFVMDLCRGSLLAQPWSDHAWLTRVERERMAELIALLKAHPECFGNPRFILGSPKPEEPYGYCCSDGRQAFVALHNCTWKDQVVPLDTVDLCSGKPRPPAGADGRSGADDAERSRQPYDMYRWYPAPARLTGDTAAMALRPFEVVLLQIVPAGVAPSLQRKFRSAPNLTVFSEQSRDLGATTSLAPRAKPMRLPCDDSVPGAPSPSPTVKRVLAIGAQVPPSHFGGTLVVTAERTRAGMAVRSGQPGKEMGISARIGGRKAQAVPVLKTHTYPAAWQAWRIAVGPSTRRIGLRALLTAAAKADVRVTCHAYFIPKGRR